MNAEALAVKKCESLLGDIASGCPAALADLYRGHAGSVFRFAYQIVGNREDAEEIVTDTFLEVWRNADKYAGESRALTWMLGIARHKALDKLRARRPFVESGDEWLTLVEATPCQMPSAYDRLIGFETGQTVHTCMARLPIEQRECLWLAFFDDMSVDDIADVQGVPANTVKTRLFYARNKLRALFKEHAVEAMEAITPVTLDTLHAMARVG